MDSAFIIGSFFTLSQSCRTMRTFCMFRVMANICHSHRPFFRVDVAQFAIWPIFTKHTPTIIIQYVLYAPNADVAYWLERNVRYTCGKMVWIVLAGVPVHSFFFSLSLSLGGYDTCTLDITCTLFIEFIVVMCINCTDWTWPWVWASACMHAHNVSVPKWKWSC